MTRWSKTFYILAIPTSVFAGIGYASGVNYSLYARDFYKRINDCIDCNHKKD
jgi:hypothetical protein